MKDYYSFVYLDNEAIDILYPQVFGDIVEKILFIRARKVLMHLLMRTY